MDRIKTNQVAEYLRPDIRRLGFVTHNLIGDWDGWVKRRVEQIEMISDTAARRRISVDFKLHRKSFGEGVAEEWREGERKKVHYVPLTLLEKTPMSKFDLRDESGVALPLLTRRKTASIGAATLVAATKSMVVEQTITSPPESEFKEALRKLETSIDRIYLPPEIEAAFVNICLLPFVRRLEDAPNTARQVAEELLISLMGKEPKPFEEWDWRFDATARTWEAKVDPEDWVAAILRHPDLGSLVFDFSRLYMICTPIDDELERRRVIKLEYVENYGEPGLAFVTGIRRTPPKSTAWVRSGEDWLEGLSKEPSTAQLEWTPYRSGMNTDPLRLSLRNALARGIGWTVKPIRFKLPSVGLGGTFHLELISPDGTQLRRCHLRALDEKKGKAKPVVEIARRYARDVTLSHLYLGGRRQGTAGGALMAIKPKSSTVIRGAALAACCVTLLVILSLIFSAGLSDSSQTSVAALLLAPGIIAAMVSQPFDHSLTSKMVFGLRLLSLAVAGVAVVAAALLGAHVTFCDAPAVWSALVVFDLSLLFVLLVAWRLAARDWPRF